MYGEKPKGPVIFAGSDSKYYMEHAPALALSASDCGFDIHFHVTNPTSEVWQLHSKLKEACATLVTMTMDREDVSRFSPSELKTHYTCVRFYALPHLLEGSRKIMTVDIDCIINKPFEFPKNPVGVMFRPSAKHGMNVLASAFYMDHRAMVAAKSIAKRLRGAEMKWFVDQVHLHEVFLKFGKSAADFDESFIDWNFRPDSCIWAGKGDRKYRDITYTNRKRNLERRITI